MSNFEVRTVPKDGIVQLGARPSAGAVNTTFGFFISINHSICSGKGVDNFECPAENNANIWQCRPILALCILFSNTFV